MQSADNSGSKCLKPKKHLQTCETSLPVTDGDAIGEIQLQDGAVQLAVTEDDIDPALGLEVVDDGSQTGTFEAEIPQPKVRGDKKTGRNSYTCRIPDCGKTFLSCHSLKAHDMSHAAVRPFVCEWADCGRSFTTFYSMSAHCRTHTGQRPYSCTAAGCQKAFKSSSDLRRHSRVHTGDKPYACTFRGCFKRFSTLDIRKVHLRTHTGERPYPCEVANCNKSFSSQTNRKNHMRTHTGEKPFKCKHPGCDKCFAEYSTMYKHQMVHLQTSIVCDVCNKNFRHMGSYQSHRQREHGWLPAEATEPTTDGAETPEPVAVAAAAAGVEDSPQRIQLLLTELDVRTVEINGETAQVLVLPADGDQTQEADGSSDLHLLGCTEALVVEGDVSPEMSVDDPEPGEVGLSVVVDDQTT